MLLLLTVSFAGATDTRPWDLAAGLGWPAKPVMKTFDLPPVDLSSWRRPLATIQRPPVGPPPVIRRDGLEQALLGLGAEILASSFPEEPWTRDTFPTRK